MIEFSKLSMAAILVIACVSGCASQQSKPSRTFHPRDANFRETPVRVLFSSDGKLYAAYRVAEKGGTSSTLRVVIFDPMAGEEIAHRDYPVPSTRLPRVSSTFAFDQADRTLVYAELHAPTVILALDASTLDLVSSSTSSLFGEQDFAPHVCRVKDGALTLSAEKLAPHGKSVKVLEFRRLSLRLRNLRQIISDETMQVQDDFCELGYWRERIKPQQQADTVLPMDRGALGLSNRALEGWIQLFDEMGNQVAMLHNPACGFVSASVSSDQQLGIAVCERTALDESHFGETLRREAMVFETKTLRVVATFPMSRMSVKERGTQKGDIWVAAPSPVVWRAKDHALVAIPDFPNAIDVYSVPIEAGGPLIGRVGSPGQNEP